MRTQVWSSGGGTQSAAIGALIVQGRLAKPDIALIVDTGREKSATWDYMESVMRRALWSVGVDYVRIPKADYATVDLYPASGEGSTLMPIFTTQSGKMGKLPAFCSDEWKRRVAMRYLRAQGVKQCDVWMGISTDEMKRVRTPVEQWFRERYPLIFEVPSSRSECIRIVESMGWPTPPRSSCWMCPNMGDAEWRELKENSPEDFAKAVALEQEMRLQDHTAWLHKSGRPLNEVVFSEPTSQMSLGCSGMCWV